MLQKNIHEGGFLSTPHCIYSKPLSQGLSFALPLTEEENHENKAGFSVKMRNPLVRRCAMMGPHLFSVIRTKTGEVILLRVVIQTP